MDGMYREMASHPKLDRGKVWCTKCGRSQIVKAEYCLRYGWPLCCGYTMTVDSPEERRSLGDAGEHVKG
jgi:hypothetical protein